MKTNAKRTPSPLPVSEVMTRNPTALQETATIAEALALLQDLDVRHVPVINEDREVVGMISDRDLRGLPVANVLERLPRVSVSAPISQLMSTEVVKVELETPLADVVDLMLDHKIGAIPVVDGDDVLAGIVSYVDLLRVLEPPQDLPSARGQR